MSKGSVDIRRTTTIHASARVSASKRNDLFRLRFYGIDDDRLKTILTALSIVRQEAGTEFDSVALELICQQYLATLTPNSPQLTATIN